MLMPQVEIFEAFYYQIKKVYHMLHFVQTFEYIL